MELLHPNDKTCSDFSLASVLSDVYFCLQGWEVPSGEPVLCGCTVLLSHVNNTGGSSGGSGIIRICLIMLFGRLP